MKRKRRNKVYASINRRSGRSIASVKHKISIRRTGEIVFDFEENASDKEKAIAKDKANAVVSHMVLTFRYGLCLIRNGEYRVINKSSMRRLVYLSVLYGIDCAKQSMRNRIKK